MFNENLKFLRERFGMEQIDLAKKLGRKSSSSISEWEKGKYTPKMATLKQIAEIFNVNIDDLMKKDLKHPDKDVIQPLPVREIPIVSQISAGLPIYAEQNILEHTYIATKKLNTNKKKSLGLE